MDLTAVTQWTHDLLSWIGFGTIVGLLAKALLPGKDPGGALATVLVGVFGSVLGAALIVYATGQRLSPISLLGFPAALVGTMLLFLCYRLLNARGLQDFTGALRGRKPRRRVSVVEEEVTQ
jgi:uncharacterized membrane protein YeaQ/YmgE (transglycosylase-associated protein family)